MVNMEDSREKVGEPSLEQIKEFWKRCGFTQSKKTYHYEFTEKVMDWLTPSGDLSYDSARHKGHLPRADLNNLFKFAPNTVQSITITETKWLDGTIWTQCHLQVEFKEIYGEKVQGKMKDVGALALFWAIVGDCRR